MKGKKALLLVLFLAIVFVVSCKGKDIETTDSKNDLIFNELEPVKKSLGSLNIMVDPRIELLSAVQLQEEYFRLTNLEYDYKNDMKDYFKDFKSHKAVKEFKKLDKLGFNYDAPPTLMLYVSNPPNLEKKADFSEYLIRRGRGKKRLLRFIERLREFSRDANFNGFYEENISFYEEMVETVYTGIKDMKIVETLDDYYGMDVNSYNIILAPLLHSGGYGPRVEVENGLFDVYGIIGPYDVVKSEGGKNIPVYSSHIIRYLVWHEFGHSFVNPTTEKYIDEVNKYKDLYTPISDIMQSQAYGTWEACVNEHIIRAITTRLAYIHLGKVYGDIALASEKIDGFYYIDALCESLEYYENNRDTYPDFESYYPKLIEVFKKLYEEELADDFFKTDFTGPINSAFTNKDKEKVVVITPTNEKDIKLQDQIKSYAKSIQQHFFPQGEVIDDIKALERDLGDYIVVAYGTMEGNLWLDNYKDSFPFKVEEDKIEADKTYEDTGLRLITAIPNPQNHKNPLVIYTAQKAEDIVGINEIFHGPTDYVIVKNYEEISSGFYVKDKEKWTFEAVE